MTAARTVLLLSAALLSPTLPGWQLQPRTLAERVDDSSVIVVARIAETISRTAAPIAGVGDSWEVKLTVVRTLKGRIPVDARVTFVDVCVQDRPAFRPDEARLWLLKSSASPAVLAASAAYESVLVSDAEPQVRALLERAGSRR